MKGHWRLSSLGLALLGISTSVILVLLLTQAARQTEQMERLHQEQVALEHSLQANSAGLHALQQLARISDALAFVSRNRLDTLTLVRISNRLFHLSRTMEFDPLLVLALVSAESKGNPRALGRFRSGTLSGAMGLMQIKPETARLVARSLGEPLPTDAELLRPEANLYFGTTYLLQLIHRYRSLERGIFAYNIGPGALNQALRNRTLLPKHYYNKVLSNYHGLVARFGPDPYS